MCIFNLFIIFKFLIWLFYFYLQSQCCPVDAPKKIKLFRNVTYIYCMVLPNFFGSTFWAANKKIFAIAIYSSELINNWSCLNSSAAANNGSSKWNSSTNRQLYMNQQKNRIQYYYIPYFISRYWIIYTWDHITKYRSIKLPQLPK